MVLGAYWLAFFSEFVCTIPLATHMSNIAMEKDPGGYTLLHNNLEIYIYTNYGDYRAAWFADDIIFTVSFYPGSPDSITEQEFLMIVESIPK